MPSHRLERASDFADIPNMPNKFGCPECGSLAKKHTEADCQMNQEDLAQQNQYVTTEGIEFDRY